MDENFGGQCYLARQPILDVRQNVVAYELLFRAGMVAVAGVSDDRLATSSVIANTIGQLGIEQVLGKHDGFINVSREILMSDVLDLLPPTRVVLEILETVEIDPQVVQRCQELKARGYRLALDDFVYSPAYDALLDAVDIVKVDLMQSSPQEIAQTLDIVKRRPRIRLLAEKVEHQEDFERCKALGFRLFQGFFFARPTVMTGKKVQPDQEVLMRVIAQLSGDAEIDQIEKTFKESPSLIVGLLRLVNSVGIGLNRQVGSLNQAIFVLGCRQLLRWAQLLLYTRDGSSDGNPILQLAAVRGKLMELLAQASAGDASNAHIQDRAFMVGMLSLVDAAIGMSMEDILSQLGLDDSVRDALLRREGRLGQLLRLVEAMERDRFDDLAASQSVFRYTPNQINQALLQAMQWSSGLDA